jgi:hypothetical protein
MMEKTRFPFLPKSDKVTLKPAATGFQHGSPMIARHR